MKAFRVHWTISGVDVVAAPNEDGAISVIEKRVREDRHPILNGEDLPAVEFDVEEID